MSKNVPCKDENKIVEKLKKDLGDYICNKIKWSRLVEYFILDYVLFEV